MLMNDYRGAPGTERGSLGQLINVIANAAGAGWGETARTTLLLIVGSAAIALIVIAQHAGHL